MQANKLSNRFISIYGLAAGCGLLIMAVVFAKYRVIFTDSANNLFYIIQSRSVYVTHYRFISALFELPAVIGVHLNASFPALVKLYSLGYFIPEMVVIFILTAFYKDYYKALLVILLLIVGNNYDFYYTIADFHKGIYGIILLWAILERFFEDQFQNSRWTVAAIGLLLITITWQHPLLIFCFSFLYAYMAIKERSLIKDRRFLYICMVTVFLFAIKIVFFRTSYEASRFSVGHALHTNFPYLTSKLALSFFSNILTHQLSFLAIVVLNLMMLYKNDKKILTLYVVSFLFYLLLITGCYGDNLYDHYYEYLLKPLVFFTLLVFVDMMIRQDGSKFLIQGIFLVIMLYGLFQIYQASSYFQKRFGKMEQVLRVMEKNKVYKGFLFANKFGERVNDDRWNIVLESLLCTAYDGRDKCRTFEVTFNPDEVRNFIGSDSTVFFQEYTKTPVKQLNPAYFYLPDKPYISLDSLVEVHE